MLVSMKWLNEYVDLSGIDVKTFEEKMIMSGSNTEGVQRIDSAFSHVVVGRIDSIRQHPNADKLVVCQTDIGADQPVQIVTGAKNMKEGDYIPVALPGARLAGGLEIKAGELRGEISQGMFCSLQELGFDDKVIPKAFQDGLLILNQAYPLGQNIASALAFDDDVVEFEITPNRPDCLSMIGMAREAAATFGKRYKQPDTSIKVQAYDIAGKASVKIDAPDKCARYACKVVEDVRIAPSPQWLQSKLIKAGMRPINNIVDITNYVLLEYGQPIHAFDLDKIGEHSIVVRNAQPGETLKTLDQTERRLSEDMLVIADSTRALAIAGVMGGADSEVSAATTRLLIEVANFERSSIRETSKALGLRSEASARYEKGVSPELVLDALNRVCHLIEKLEAGTVISGVIDKYPRPQEIPEIVVRPARINALIGIELATDDMVRILQSLGCAVTMRGERMIVRPPYYRLDLQAEVDFSEEIARIYGYDKIEDSEPQDYAIGRLTPMQKFESAIELRLSGLGLSQIVTYSFLSDKVIDWLNDTENPKIKDNVIIRNPLGEEFSVMRPSLLPNMLQTIARNLKRQVSAVQLFELGNVFEKADAQQTAEPIEIKKMVIGVAGGNNDFYSIKGVLDSLFTALKVQPVSYLPDLDHATYHPGRCAKVLVNDTAVGYVGELHPTVQDSFEIPKRVYIAELDLEKLFAQRTPLVRYNQLPKFPAATRDIAITVDQDITNQAISDLIKEHGGDYLESVKLFDVYQGEQIEAGKKSMAYALSFRADDRTLVEDDIVQSWQRILDALQSKVNAILR